MTMTIDRFGKKWSGAEVVLFLFLAVTAVGAVFFLVGKGKEEKPVSSQPVGYFRPSPEKIDGESFPSGRIDLSKWKLNVPVAVEGGSSLRPDIWQPELDSFQLWPWFVLSEDKKGVVFRAPVNAPTTGNSEYPRSELREVVEDAKEEEKFWSSKVGVHTLFLDQAITAVPRNKPVVVAGQIHGDDDDLLVIRLEHPKLHVTRSKSDVYTLDENYTLGKRFTIKFVAADGKIAVYYNGSSSPVYTLEKEVDEAYFKAGVYTQSNCETEESADLCTADNFGEVVIYQAVVSHQ